MPGFLDMIRSSFNVLDRREEEVVPIENTVIAQMGGNGVYRQLWRDTSSAVMSPVITRLAIDAARTPIRHVTLNEFGAYKETRVSELNDRLTLNANLDQSGRAFIQDAVTTMLTEGVCALVPIETTMDPKRTSSYDIISLRVGTIVEWYTKAVKVSVYNESIGRVEEIIVPKSYVAICYNPLYEVMNQTNSTLKRLIDKLAISDITDSRLGSPNLDLILQLPYSIRNDKKANEAKQRRQLMEDQLYGSTYGVAYIDATEKITQLNRPVVNSLLDTVKDLTSSLYNQLGLTDAVFDGSASAEEMVLYYNRTIEPIISSLVDGMKISFLTKTARAQRQSILAIPNIFKMAPIEVMAEAADKLTRNAIVSSNEMRAQLGFGPVDTEDANKLRNKNLNEVAPPTESDPKVPQEGEMEEELDG